MYDQNYMTINIKKLDRRKVSSICDNEDYKIEREEDSFLSYYNGAVNMSLTFVRILSSSYEYTDLVQVWLLNGKKYDGYFDTFNIKFVLALKKSNDAYVLKIE